MRVSEPLVSTRPWFTAVMLATLATPAAVVIAWLAPRPLDAIVALPLVLIDIWSASAEGPLLRLLLLLLGIVLTWLLYVVAVRMVLWRLTSRSS
jgi:hypothetical protein